MVVLFWPRAGLVFFDAPAGLRKKQAAHLVVLGMGLVLGYVVAARVAGHDGTNAGRCSFLAAPLRFAPWILPGVSGSFLLLLLGLYSGVIDAVANLEAA